MSEETTDTVVEEKEGEVTVEKLKLEVIYWNCLMLSHDEWIGFLGKFFDALLFDFFPLISQCEKANIKCKEEQRRNTVLSSCLGATIQNLEELVRVQEFPLLSEVTKFSSTLVI